MTRQQRNRDIIAWLAYGLIGFVLAPHRTIWALSYVVGSACALYMQRRGWL